MRFCRWAEFDIYSPCRQHVLAACADPGGGGIKIQIAMVEWFLKGFLSWKYVVLTLIWRIDHVFIEMSTPGLSKPTGPVKPARSGSGLQDRFDRKPVKTGQIQNQIQNRMFNRFRTAYRSVWLVTGQIQIFFLFWFKFKCPQSILNKCLYNIFWDQGSQSFVICFHCLNILELL